MSERYTRAILRVPGENFAAGLTSAAAGAPDLLRAQAQHRHYAAALAVCGLELATLPADARYPDGTFVEDTAVLTPDLAIVTRPGAPSRRGETAAIATELASRYATVRTIAPPGTVDGGDVCQAGTRFFIGLSARTNEHGARQLAGWLAESGFAATFVDIRSTPGLLHLKTGIAYLGDARLAVMAGLAGLADFDGYETIEVAAQESYAANCIRVNARVLVAAGHPRFADRLAALGLDPLPLEMSEFRKMDGGLSCLSLRF